MTDADAVLGVLRPESFLGGGMGLDTAAARRAYEGIADALGCSVEDAAERVLGAAHAEAGARLAHELTERGVDPAGATVLAFGGNGATHGAAIAEAAGITGVLVVDHAPVFSAYGASTVDIRYRREARAGDAAEETLRRGVSRDLRGEGIAVEDGTVVVEEFERDGARWLAVEGSYALPHVAVSEAGAVVDGESAPPRRISVRWPGVGVRDTALTERAALRPGVGLDGPALVDSPATTCVVPPGWRLTVDEYGTSRLTALDRRSA